MEAGGYDEKNFSTSRRGSVIRKSFKTLNFEHTRFTQYLQGFVRIKQMMREKARNIRNPVKIVLIYVVL